MRRPEAWPRRSSLLRRAKRNFQNGYPIIFYSFLFFLDIYIFKIFLFSFFNMYGDVNVEKKYIYIFFSYRNLIGGNV